MMLMNAANSKRSRHWKRTRLTNRPGFTCQSHRSTEEKNMRTPPGRRPNCGKRKEERARCSVRRDRDLDALQIEEYIATVVTNRHNLQRNRQTRKLLQTVLSTAHLLRAAGIEADGND